MPDRSMDERLVEAVRYAVKADCEEHGPICLREKCRTARILKALAEELWKEGRRPEIGADRRIAYRFTVFALKSAARYAENSHE